MSNAPKVKSEMTLENKRKAIAESGIVVGVILLLCYFFGFSYIWNTGYGTEASVNGWNYIFACIAWNFKGTEWIYGSHLAVPFNYYAKIYVRILAVATTVSFAVVLAYIIMSVFNIKKFNKKLEITTMVILYVLAFVFLFCLVVALAMNGSKILPKFCGSNPQCSIATLIFFPFFIALITAIIHSVFIYKNKEEETEK